MKLSKEELIKQFKKIHGDKYDYSKVEYVNTDTKVIIICQKHGEFQQTPDKHKSGQSCPKCRGLGRLTTEEVIQQFKEVHRDRYDYSEVKYKNVDSKVIIKCKEHGIFLQSPYNHRKGKGCPKCSGAGLSQEEIIEQFRMVHGNEYDYTKMEYVNTRSFITVICPEHGEFRQIANSHKQGSGCPKCSGTLKLTGREIIDEFRNVHGNKYDYSKVEYQNSNSKVIIICPEHGEFKQTPSSHKYGSGCPKCLGMGVTTEEIIQQFKAAHGDIYDYSKVKYLNNNEEVIIICKVHGSFLQIPRIHKLGSGCPKCAGRGFSTEEIIEQFRKRHGGKYDYSKVEYSDARIPVTIICPEHGIFLQTSDSHKRGAGCPKCSGRGFSNEEIIQEFEKVHGDRYDYSKVKYQKSSSKVIIICSEHGEFLQSPDTHKQGVGCPKCAGTKKLTREEVISAFEKKHSNKYDYSKVEYVNIDTKVIIICPIHGEFLQTPNIHKNGGGCPTCNRGWSKTKILEFLHTIENQDLLQMDAVELQMIINQGKLPEVFRELVFTDGENKENTLKALKEKLQNSLEDEMPVEPLSAESKEEDWNQDEAEQEDLEISEETDSLIETEKQKLLSLSEKNEDLHMLDHNLVSSCDGEAIEFLIQYKLRKIWNKVLNNEFSVDHFRTETGGANFTLLQKYFFEEYNQVQKYSPPAGYCFPYEPNLMQKLTVFRLLKHQRYGNWSGTGAGKTISFILASRSIDARLTVLIGLNSTIGQLKETILQVYPDSRVETYYKPGNIFDRNFRNYLILNYDKFQQEYSEELFQDLTDSNQ